MINSYKHLPLLNIFFNLSASLTLRATSLIVTSILIKGIGEEAFGNYIYIITTALLLTTFSAMATGQAFIKNLSSDQHKNDSFSYYFSNIFVLFIVFSVLLYLYAFIFTPNQHIIENFGLILLIAFLELINTAYISYFSGKEKFSKILNARIIFSVLLCAIVFVSVYYDSYLSVYPYAIALLISNSYFFFVAKPKLHIGQSFLTNLTKFRAFCVNYIKLSFPIFISGLMVTPVQWYLSNQIVLQNGFAELGLFNVSMQFRMMILMITNALATALLPRLVQLNNTDAFERIKNTGYYCSAVFCLIMIVVISLLMPFVFNFYSIEINEDILFASYLMLSTALPLCIYNLYTQVLIVKGKTKDLLIFNSFWGICVISLYNIVPSINNIVTTKILCFSYFSLIIFVFLYNKFNKI